MPPTIQEILGAAEVERLRGADPGVRVEVVDTPERFAELLPAADGVVVSGFRAGAPRPVEERPRGAVRAEKDAEPGIGSADDAVGGEGQPGSTRPGRRIRRPPSATSTRAPSSPSFQR
jgi:hypothetical protein